MTADADPDLATPTGVAPHGAGQGGRSQALGADGQFRLIVEASPNAILVVDAQGRIRVVNRRCEELFGYDRSELIGASIEVLVPDRFKHRHPDHVGAYFSAPSTRAMGAGRELFARRADGSELQVEIQLSPYETPDGALTLASVIDITERAAAAEHFRLAVEAAPNAMILLGPDRRIRLVNRKAEEMFGYQRQDIVGEAIELLVPERNRHGHPDLVSNFLDAPGARPMGVGRELYGRRRDGGETPIEIGLNPINTSNGVYVLAAIIDISERLEAQALRNRLAAIVEDSDDAIIGKSLDGRIRSWNRGAQTLFGYTADEAIGQSIYLLVPEHRLEEEALIFERLRLDERIEPFETTRLGKDGIERAVSVSISPVRDAIGRVVAASSIARDITELKRRDAELRRSNAQLEQFAYVASHDLQEPLRMVANFTELLAQTYAGRLDERADQYIRFASDGARRMQRLISDLLAFSRVGSQGKPAVRVEAGPVVDVVLQGLSTAIERAEAIIEVGELPAVMADETQLGQLFQNLIGNALKFRSTAPCRIAISAKRERDEWVFSVADNGIGMEMQHAARIFDMFQRLHGVGQFEGSGIGLAIAKQIVGRHGGRIWVEAAPEEGSTFYFTLKAAPEVRA